MAVDRHVTISGTVALGSHVSQTDEEVHALWDVATQPLITVGGTGNAITGTVEPTLDAYANGMGFVFVAEADSTGDVTINIDSRGIKQIRDASGAQLASGALVAGTQYEIRYDGTWFRLAGTAVTAAIGSAVAALDAALADVDAALVSVDSRDDDALSVADANDILALEVEPSGALAIPAVLADNVSGVSANWLRRQHLSTVARVPMCVGLFGFGQSNELGNKADAISTLRSGRNMRMMVGGVRAFAGSGTPTENRESLVPHVEAFVAAAGDTPDRGETNRFGTAESLLDLIETEQGWGDYASQLMTIASSSGEGSTTIAQLMEAERLDRFALDVEAAAGFADDLFDAVLAVPGIDYNQIEGDVAAETPADEWIDQMVDLQATIEGIVNTARGVATSDATRVPLIIHQSASWNYSAVSHDLARAAVTLAQTSDRFILLPSYMKTFPDDVHYTAADHHGVDGARIGFVWKRLLINAQARSTFAPTVPTAHDTEGKWAFLTFHTWASDPLTVDTRLVTKVANLGLTALEDDETTPVTIEKVYVQPTGLAIKFASTIGAGTFLDYALEGAGDPGRNSGPRGNLRTTLGEHVQVRTMQGVRPVHEWVPAFRYQMT